MTMTKNQRAEYGGMLFKRMRDLQEKRDVILAEITLTDPSYKATIDRWYKELIEVTDQYNKLNTLKYHLSKGY